MVIQWPGAQQHHHPLEVDTEEMSRTPSTDDSKSSGATSSSTSARPTPTAPAPTARPSTSKMRRDRTVIYVNMVVLDATDAIDRQLQLDFKDVPRPLHKVAAKLATTWATPERVAEVMAVEVPKNLVAKMAAKGMTAVAEAIFWEGPYVVLQIQVHSVSTTAMVEAQSKDFYDEDTGELEEGAHMNEAWATRLSCCVQRILQLLGVRTQQSLENDYFPRLIQYNIDKIMDECIAEKLEKKRVKAITKVLPESKQARYFFETLQEVREAQNKPFTNFAEMFQQMPAEEKSELLGITHVTKVEKKVV